MKRLKSIDEILRAYKDKKTFQSVRDYILLKRELRIYDMDFLNALGVASRFKKLKALVNSSIDLSLKEIDLK
jgi:hypothetical protein